MKIAIVGRLWLTLILLLATLSSFPLGSMEQGRLDSIGRGSPTDSSPAIRTQGRLKTAELYLPEPGIRPPLPHSHPLHRERPVLTERVGVSILRREPRTDAPEPPRVCESLPYDANAPPIVG